MLAGVADCRRSRKSAAKEDGNWDLNLAPAAIGKRRDHVALKGRRDHVALKGRRDHAASKSREDHKVLGEKEETTRLQST